MTIDEAIENRTTDLRRGEIPKSSDDYNAALLSIEALKRIKECRHADYMIAEDYLPGETK